MKCDLCGNNEAVMVADIEGASLNVCSNCSRFGKPIRPVSGLPKAAKKQARIEPAMPEVEEVIVADYAGLIRNARERSGMNQEDFAKKLNEKVSVIHKIETGSFEPDIAMARKLEKILGIKLVEKHEEVHQKQARRDSNHFTIGDLIDIKKKG